MNLIFMHYWQKSFGNKINLRWGMIPNYSFVWVLNKNYRITPTPFFDTKQKWRPNLLYHSKEEIHSEIELTIYKLKWYSRTNIISLTLLVLCPKLVLLLTKVFQYWIFVSASHQTGLDTRSMSRRSIIVRV